MEKISRASVGISQYITPRFAAAEVGKYAAPLKARIAELEDPPAARDGQGSECIDDKEVHAILAGKTTSKLQINHHQLRK